MHSDQAKKVHVYCEPRAGKRAAVAAVHVHRRDVVQPAVTPVQPAI